MKYYFIATEKYRAGYTDCAREVAKYLSTPEPPPLPSVPSISDPGCKARLLRHLDQCILEIDTEICPSSVSGQHSSVDHVGYAGIKKRFVYIFEKKCYCQLYEYLICSQDDNSMDYSSQDSNPLDFSRNNKELMHQHLIAHGLMPHPEEDRRSNTSGMVI